MFSVYGKSLQVAKKMADKIVSNKNSSISIKLKKMVSASQSEKQKVIDDLVIEIFKSMKPKRCTHEFSTPEIAKECYALMEKETANFSDLSIMKKRPKKNSKGGLVISKSTRKPLMEWVPLHEEEQNKQAE